MPFKYEENDTEQGEGIPGYNKPARRSMLAQMQQPAVSEDPEEIKRRALEFRTKYASNSEQPKLLGKVRKPDAELTAEEWEEKYKHLRSVPSVPVTGAP